jgi:hypothetical protein
MPRKTTATPAELVEEARTHERARASAALARQRADLAPSGAQLLRTIGRLHDREQRALAAADDAAGQLRAAVDDARAQGLPWLLIAHQLGVTAQAAQQRFSKPRGASTSP